MADPIYYRLDYGAHWLKSYNKIVLNVCKIDDTLQRLTAVLIHEGKQIWEFFVIVKVTGFNLYFLYIPQVH